MGLVWNSDAKMNTFVAHQVGGKNGPVLNRLQKQKSNTEIAHLVRSATTSNCLRELCRNEH